MKSYYFIVIFCCLLISCSDPIKYYEQANLLGDRGEYHKAIKYFDKAIKLDPLFIDAYINRGVDKSSIGDYNGAISDYTKVIEIDSSNVLAYFNRACRYNDMENYSLALLDINKAYQLMTKNMITLDSAQINITISQLPKHGSMFALDNLSGGKYDVDLPDILYERGLIFISLDSLENAFMDIDYCIERSFMLDETYYWRGMISLKLGLKDEGCEDLHLAQKHGSDAASFEIMKYCNR